MATILPNRKFVSASLTTSLAVNNGLVFTRYSRENGPASPSSSAPPQRALVHVCRDLQTACDEGDVEKLEQIITSSGVDPSDRILRGKPPLYWAVARGKLAVVRLLVEKYGCSTQFVTEHGGTTLFHAACSRGHVDVARYLASSSSEHTETTALRKDGSTPLMAACFYGHVEVVKYLVEELGCNIQLPVSCSTDGSLFHIACSNNKVDVARYLVSACKMDPNATGSCGETSLHLACGRGHLEVVKYLNEELNCSLEARDVTSNTPLHMCAQNDQHVIVQYLLQNCCKTEVVNSGGFTPLMLACRYGKQKSARLLLELGNADPNCQNHNNVSALQCTRDKTIITELVRHGADTTNFVSSVLEYHQKQSSLEALVRMFVVGHPMAGKSTLVEAMKTGVHVRLFNKKKVTGVAPLTAGIVPVEFESPDLGRVLLFDFAGQNEYYASHAALLEATKTSAPLFILVANLLESEGEIKFQINFWLSFINNHHVPGTSIAHIAVIGSHKDKLHKDFPLIYHQKTAVVESVVHNAVREYNSLKMVGFFALDCRKPHKHVKLRGKLRESCTELRSNSEIDGCCHILSTFLTEKFAGETTCTVEKLIEEIMQSDLALPCTVERMCELVEALSKRQNILFLRNDSHLEQSWIVLEVDTLLTKINGVIFAPASFKEHRTCPNSGAGVLPWSHLQQTFQELNLDPELVVAFLKKLEFCQEVFDADVLALIQQGGTPSSCDPCRSPSPHHLSPSSVERDFAAIPTRSVTTPGRFCGASRNHVKRDNGTNLFENEMQFREEDTGLVFATSSQPPTGHKSTLGRSRRASECSRANSHLKLQVSRSHSDLGMNLRAENGSSPMIAPAPTQLPNHFLQPPLTLRQKTMSNPDFECGSTAPQANTVLGSRRSQGCNQFTWKRETRFFFFPGLLNHERPSGDRVWSPHDSFQFHTGWCMQVAHTNQFFTPRLLQILLLRIAFGFAVTKRYTAGNGNVGTRQCTVWKNGIRWLDLNGIETVVEMVEQNRTVVVLMRGKVNAELDCVALRSKLIQLVLEVKRKFCPNLQIDQYLMDPKDIADQPYPFAHRSLESMTLYEMSMVMTSIVELKEWVFDTRGQSLCPLANLLYFEPYVNLGGELLGRLFSEESEHVTDDKLYDFLHEYSQAHYTHSEELSAILLKIRKTSSALSMSCTCSCGSMSHLLTSGSETQSHQTILQSGSIPLNGRYIYYTLSSDIHVHTDTVFPS